MKNKLLLILICFAAANLANAQTTVKKEYHITGELLSTQEYKNGKKDGWYKIYNLEGTLTATFIYKNGLKQGESKSYYDNGTLSEAGQFLNDKQTGLWKKWNDEGVLIAEDNYKNGKKVGISKAYYKSGEIRSITEYKETNSRKETSTHKWFYKNGIIEGSQSFIESVRQDYKTYYETGVLSSSSWVLKDNGRGPKENFYPSGKLSSTGNFKFSGSDKIDDWKYYYESGQLKAIGSYTYTSDKEGEWKHYYDNGKLEAIKVYKWGRKVGQWKYYDREGNLTKTLSY